MTHVLHFLLNPPAESHKAPVGELFRKVAADEKLSQSQRPPTGFHSVSLLLEKAAAPAFSAGVLVGDPSVLAGSEGENRGRKHLGKAAFLTEVFKAARDIASSGAGTIADFLAQTEFSIDPHHRDELLKRATVAAGQPYQPPVMPQPAAYPQAPSPAPSSTTPAPGARPVSPGAMPQAAPGHATLTGIQQRPLGLDRPCDTRAAAVPGLAGSAATNVIDQQGGLDPRGLKVDGNNAAGISKLAPGMTMKMASPFSDLHERFHQEVDAAEWRRLIDDYAGVPSHAAAPAMALEIQQLLKTAADREHAQDMEKEAANGWPISKTGLGTALGLGGLALGGHYLANGMATDQQAARVQQAARDYNPRAFTHGELPPNYTGLTYYQKTLSPAAQLKPFGRPVGEALVGLRSNPQVMEALGTKGYTLTTAADQQGVGGMAHYTMFGNGPVPAYAHQMKARLSGLQVPSTLGVPENTMYSDWMGRKLEDFVTQQTGQRINPFEFTTKFMPHEEQLGLMERFHQSLTPEEQAFRIQSENPGAGYANQVGNYLPKAQALVDTRQRLKDLAVAGGGAAAGALGGDILHNLLTQDDDPTNDDDPTVGRTLATVGGAGLGGLAAYGLGTQNGRQYVQGLLNQVMGKTAADDQWIGVDLDGTLAQYDGWVAEDHIGDPIDKMVQRVKGWLADGKTVKIFTARVADDPDGTIKKTIQDWTEEHIGQRLDVTNEKDHQMESLWDDRAHRVEKNTGVKLAHVEPMPRWRNPPTPDLDPAFLASEGVQNLLRSLGCRSTPDGKIEALTFPGGK